MPARSVEVMEVVVAKPVVEEGSPHPQRRERVAGDDDWREDLTTYGRLAYKKCVSTECEGCRYFDEQTQCWLAPVDLTGFEEPETPVEHSRPEAKRVDSGLEREWREVERCHDQQIATFLCGGGTAVKKYLAGGRVHGDDWLRAPRLTTTA